MKKTVGTVCGIVIFVIVLIIILIAVSLKKLASYEAGVPYDTVGKSLGSSVKTEGLHNGPPGFEFIVFPNVYRSIEFTGVKCLNRDGVEIRLSVTYQYKTDITKLREIILEFRDHENYVKLLRLVGESALHEACSKFDTNQFQAQRAEFQNLVVETVKDRYKKHYCHIADLQVNNIMRPVKYEDAVREKEAAKENVKVARNEGPTKLTKANTARLEALTQARITLDKAESEARIMKIRAASEAEAILNQYKKEAEVYKEILNNVFPSGPNRLEAFLSYIGVRTIGSAQNPVFVSLKGPAKTSYVKNP